MDLLPGEADVLDGRLVPVRNMLIIGARADFAPFLRGVAASTPLSSLR